MEMTLHVDLSAKKIAELVDQLPAREFVKMKGLIETKARARFRAATASARREFRRSGLTRKDVESALAEVRGKAT
jgi:hypothetical protein